jgi:CxxC motif-containing protein (DUF1111 family)
MNSKSAILLTSLCLQLGWSGLTLKIVDGQNNPMAGVSCAVLGGTPVVSDAAGAIELSKEVGIFGYTRRADAEPSLSRIPLAAGEKATLTILNIKGQRLLSRTLSLGDRIPFTHSDKGVFFVSITGRGFSTRGHFANLGREVVFEGIRNEPVKALARTGAVGARAIPVSCGKTGMPTQVYQVREGEPNIIDFGKLQLVPLFDASTKLQPDNIIETPTALITRFSDRGRDRHAREDEYKKYDHFLTHYWNHRTATIELTDEIAKGGKKIRIDVVGQWKFDSTAREFRAFYKGMTTVAEYHFNYNMNVDPKDSLHYWVEITYNEKERRAIKIGDKIEIEISQFLDKKGLIGRDNYYGTTYLYIVGQGGMVPWETRGVFGDGATEREDSYPIPEEGWLGGRTTVHRQYTDEPDDVFMQMATNLAPRNGQVFVHGRRVHHTSFVDGSHDEPDNPGWDTLKAKAGPNHVNISCTSCHHKNGRALPPAVGSVLSQYVVKVGDAAGNPHPMLGSVLQPKRISGTPEGSVTLSGWAESNGLRKPEYAFSGAATPANHSARITPQLVGLGLLEAVPEAAIMALADPDDIDKDGISGKMQIVSDYASGQPRMGRFGWKAGKPSVGHQVAGALNSDIGVMTSLYPAPDCGSAQGDCGPSGSEIADVNLQNLIDYVSLLGVRARRDLKDPAALQGEELFKSMGCAACHIPKMVTALTHPLAELRNQIIHPFTDLLLHDMGPGLADNLPEGLASGSEWRTAPLWNIGMTAGVSGGEAYLHDGRARTLKEAILWHGGEADASATKFKALPAVQQDAVLKFLKSL